MATHPIDAPIGCSDESIEATYHMDGEGNIWIHNVSGSVFSQFIGSKGWEEWYIGQPTGTEVQIPLERDLFPG